MPSHPNLERLIGAAVVDREFRNRLLKMPVQVAVDFGLSTDELRILASARASTLEDLSAHVWAWSTRATTEGRSIRSIAASWVPEVRDPVRVAV